MEIDVFLLDELWRFTEPDAYEEERQLQLLETDLLNRLRNPALHDKILNECMQQPQFRADVLKQLNRQMMKTQLSQLITKARFERQVKASNADELLQNIYSKIRRDANLFLKDHFMVTHAEEDFNSRLRSLSGPARTKFQFMHHIVMTTDEHGAKHNHLKAKMIKASKYQDDDLIKQVARLFKPRAADAFFWHDVQQFSDATPNDLIKLDRFDWSDFKESPEEIVKTHLAPEWLDINGLARFIARECRGVGKDGSKTLHIRMSSLNEFVQPIFSSLRDMKLSLYGEEKLTDAVAHQLNQSYKKMRGLHYDEVITLQQLNGDLSITADDLTFYRTDLQVRQAVEKLNKIVDKSKCIHYKDPFLIRRLGLTL